MNCNWFKHPKKANMTGVEKFVHITVWVIVGICAAVAFVAAFSFAIQWLWNSLMPDIFGLPTINYWQAIGLFVLSKLLLGCGGLGSDKSKDSCDPSKEEDIEDKKMEENFENYFKQLFCSDHGVETSKDQYQEYWEKEGRDSFKKWLEKQKESSKEEE